MDTQTIPTVRKPAKKREKVTAEKCYEFLTMAFYETMRFGVTSPLKWEQQAGRKLLPSIAKNIGFIFGKRNTLRYFDMQKPPTQKMSEELLEAYTIYRQKHGLADQNRRRAEAKAKLDTAETDVFSDDVMDGLMRDLDPDDGLDTLKVAIMALRVEVLALTEGMDGVGLVMQAIQADLRHFMHDCGSDKDYPLRSQDSRDDDEEQPF